MLQGEELPHCNIRYDNERLGRLSRRQFSNDLFLKQIGKGEVDQFFDRLVDVRDQLTAKTPVFFDLRLGNICNLKCRMCWPGYSSQIERDPVAARWSGSDGTPRIIGETINDWQEAPGLLERLKLFSAEAVRIEMIGGETTINEPQLELLRHFVATGKASDIELFVISNLTNARDSVFGLFAAFKNPTIDISLEGIGHTFEYIRFPGKWAAIARNVTTVQRKYPNIALSVTPVYQAYNILNICDLYDWCLANGIICKTYNILYLPAYLSVCVLPQEARDVAAARLEQWAASRGLDSGFMDGIRGIAQYLRDESQRAAPEQVEAFVRYTNDLDASRGQDIRESLPEALRAVVQAPRLGSRRFPALCRRRVNGELDPRPGGSVRRSLEDSEVDDGRLAQ